MVIVWKINKLSESIVKFYSHYTDDYFFALTRRLTLAMLYAYGAMNPEHVSILVFPHLELETIHVLF